MDGTTEAQHESRATAWAQAIFGSMEAFHQASVPSTPIWLLASLADADRVEYSDWYATGAELVSGEIVAITPTRVIHVVMDECPTGGPTGDHLRGSVRRRSAIARIDLSHVRDYQRSTQSAQHCVRVVFDDGTDLKLPVTDRAADIPALARFLTSCL